MTTTITTKYNVGDRVYVLYNGSIINPVITAISLWLREKGIEVSYIVDKPYTGGSFKEGIVFPTKQDLINSL